MARKTRNPAARRNPVARQLAEPEFRPRVVAPKKGKKKRRKRVKKVDDDNH